MDRGSWSRSDEIASAPVSDAQTETDIDDAGGQPAEFRDARALLVVRLADPRSDDDLPDVRVIEVGPGQAVTIGRAPESTVLTSDARVSRRHAEIEARGDALVLTDLSSRNGSRHNGNVLRGTSKPLRSGDVVAVGPFEIVVAAAQARRSGPTEPAAPSGLVIADPSMVDVFRIVRRVAVAPTTVLVTGETGVGKELVADAIHHLSPRRGGPFVRINCAAIPATLLESQLFGHEKGAFTGADRRHHGIFEQAHGGTLFLDEVGDIPIATQVGLLRVLEARVVRRLGGDADIPVDVRIVCATHRDLAEMVPQGLFRQDLFYRLNPITITVPPLRARRTEIILLADSFLRALAEQHGRAVPEISEAAARALVNHEWPGNIRELKNVMERAFILADSASIEVDALPFADTANAAAAGGGVRGEMADLEKARILEALRAHRNNRTHAARALGMSRRALLYKLQKYGVA